MPERIQATETTSLPLAKDVQLRSPPAKRLSARVSELLISEGLVIAFVALFILFAWQNPIFLSSANLINILRQTAEIGIGAAGQMVVVLAAGIDLSVGSVLAISGLAAAVLATHGTLFGNIGLDPGLAMIVAILLGAALGAINGLAVTQLRVAPIIATLAAMTFIRGLVYTWSNGIPIYSGLPDFFSQIGAGYIAGVAPIPVVLLIATYVVIGILLTKTTFGTYVYAIGGNAEAARLSGIPVNTILVLTYVISACTASLAGIMVMGRVHSAQPLAGSGWELDTITAVALAGVSLFGGRGSLIKVFLAALTLAVLSNGFVLLGLSPYGQMIIKGLILLFAVALDMFLSRRKRAQAA